jgi:hypothetical protein
MNSTAADRQDRETSAPRLRPGAGDHRIARHLDDAEPRRTGNRRETDDRAGRPAGPAPRKEPEPSRSRSAQHRGVERRRARRRAADSGKVAPSWSTSSTAGPSPRAARARHPAG